ncbi:class I SAM-dependent methyltransferase [Ferrovibrio sp.]|uniref:class I SAM-dependent methyltransferase n=1 Tax=Ferrovibrio sp. TaxID=1917215 RepID=UPI00311DD777
MERSEYLRMAAQEGSMWWYRALHARLLDLCAPDRLAAGRTLLDAGCGTGGLLARLVAQRPDLVLAGLEYDGEAAAIARSKTGRPVTAGSVHAMPFADAQFDAIVSADVLCHAGVDPGLALAEFHRCLRPGGLLVLNLPAYHWMASAHDAHVGNVRRFTAGECRRLAAAAGFGPVETGYWNSLLFPLMLLHRLAAGRSDAHSDVRAFPAWQDRLFFTATAVERRLARTGLALPFGGSVWVRARKA